MKRNYPSGACKKKLKREQLIAAVENSSKITTAYFTSKSQEDTGNASNLSDSLQSLPKEDVTQIHTLEESSASNADGQNIEMIDSAEMESENDAYDDGDDANFDLNLEFPSDRGHYGETITDENLRQKIYDFGPCQPKGLFQEKDGIEYFKENIIISLQKEM